jgi:ribosome biogenesis GTPase A
MIKSNKDDAKNKDSLVELRKKLKERETLNYNSYLEQFLEKYRNKKLGYYFR